MNEFTVDSLMMMSDEELDELRMNIKGVRFARGEDARWNEVDNICYNYMPYTKQENKKELMKALKNLLETMDDFGDLD